MAYALQQHTNFAGSGATTIAGSFSGTPTVNNLIIVGLLASGPNSPATSVTDNQASGGNTYAQIGATKTTTGGINIQIYWTVATKSSGTFTITAHFPGNAVGLKAFILEYSGNATSSPNDVSNGTTGNSTTPASISITPNQANSLVIGLMADDNADNVTITAGTNFTREEFSLINSTTNRGALEDWIQTTATSTTAPWTIGSSNTWAAASAAFKPATNITLSVSDSSAVTESVTPLVVYKPNIFDSSAVTESTTVKISDPAVNVFDSSAVTEAVTPLITYFINVFDTSTVTEAITPLITDFINTFDSSAVTENIKPLISDFISTFDTSAVTEALTIVIPTISEIVFDSSAVTEAVTIEIIDSISVSDSSAVSEAITPLLTDNININDSSTVTEAVSIVLTNFINVSDSSTVTENVSALLPLSALNISVFDSSAVTENVAPVLVNLISISDSSSVTDTLSGQNGGIYLNPLAIFVYDSLIPNQILIIDNSGGFLGIGIRLGTGNLYMLL